MAHARTLYRTGDVVFGVSWCGPLDSARSDEEVEPGFSVIFPQSGTYVRHSGQVETLATPAVVLFAEAGQVSRTSHPSGGNDRSLYLTMPEGLMAWFAGASPRAPLRPDVALAVRRTAVHAAKGGIVPSLHLEELALTARTTNVGRAEVTDHQRIAVGRAEEYLACHFAEDAALRTIGREVGYSPHHLSRLFRRATGMSLTAYRTRLRLAAAIERLLAGDTDIARVAVDCGFYDHPHLVRQLRRQVGHRPGEIRGLEGLGEEPRSG